MPSDATATGRRGNGVLYSDKELIRKSLWLVKKL